MVIENNKRTVKIGKQGDNLATEIIFPLDADFADCNVSVLVRRPTEKTAYPMECTVESDGIHVTVSKYETEKIGYGAMEVWYTKDDVVKKSTRYETLVSKAIVGTIDEEYDPYQNYFERIVEAGARAEAGAQTAEGFAMMQRLKQTKQARVHRMLTRAQVRHRAKHLKHSRALRVRKSTQKKHGHRLNVRRIIKIMHTQAQ